VRNDGARNVEDAADIGIEHRLHVVVLERGELVVADDARIVDQDVDAAAAIRDTLHGGSAGRRVAHVDLVGGDLASGGIAVGDHSVRRIGVAAIEKRDVAPFVGQHLDDRAADATAAAGDDDALAGQSRIDLHPEMQNPPSTTSVWPLIIAASGRHSR